MSERTTSDQVLRIFIGLFASVVLAATAAGVWRFVKYAHHPPGGIVCRSKQSEAKTNLSGLWTSEKAFFGEYGTYSTDLVALDWSPIETPRYLYGFARPGGATAIKGVDDLDPTRDTSADPRVIAAARKLGNGYETTKMQDFAGNPLTASELPATAVLTSNGFVAAAIGDVNVDDKVSLDIWTIDQAKQLTNVRNDCSY